MNDVQRRILNIYKEVKKVCDRNNITYYGSSGTCLGAVRHGGFIPWDDDMDLVIPIEQIDHFLDVASRELPDYLEISTPFEKIHLPHLMIKIVDKRTTFVEKSLKDYEDSWSGIWLDIIPVCGVPKNIFIRKIFYARLYLLMHLDLYMREDYMGSHFVLIQKMIKNFIITHRDANYYMNKQLKFLKNRVTIGSEWIMQVGFLHFENWTTRNEWFGEGKLVKFEDAELVIPKDYDKYLEKEFGDYMTLPEEEGRTTHQGFIDINRSYKEYIKTPEIVREYFERK